MSAGLSIMSLPLVGSIAFVPSAFFLIFPTSFLLSANADLPASSVFLSSTSFRVFRVASFSSVVILSKTFVY